MKKVSQPAAPAPVRVARAAHDSARKAFVETCRQGNLTLVLGAGVSIPQGIPNWNDLGRRVWDAAFPKEDSPWNVPKGVQSPREVPQFLPIVFELAARKLGDGPFVELLRQCLYRDVPRTWARNLRRSRHTLAVLARAILLQTRADHRRRLLRVITFNADDLLETAVRQLHGRFVKRPVQVIARPSAEPVWNDGRDRLPFYHVHGFVPRDEEKGDDFISRRTRRSYDHLLVFTDEQYWRSTAAPLAHANRIVAGALSDSHCVFVGLSMTDANLLRWLALRRLEFESDARERALRILDEEMDARGHVREARPTADGSREPPPGYHLKAATRIVEQKLQRHFWIRPRSADPTGFLSDFLRLRGVISVEIADWTGPSFSTLMRAAFRD